VCIQKNGVQDQTIQSTETIIIYDSSGNKVELAHPATRIIPLDTQSVKMLIMICSGDRIVGVAESAKNHKEIMVRIMDVPSVGSKTTHDIKKILSLKPDLETILLLKPDVLRLYGLSSGHQAKNLENILAQNISVISLDCYKLEGVSNDVYALGIMTGNSTGAERYIQFNQKYQRLVESRLANQPPDEIPDVYAESATDYTVLNRATGIGQVLDALHARNAYGNSTTYEFPKLNSEWVIKNDPEIILKNGESTSGISLNATYTQILSRKGYDQLKSVRDKQVYVYNNDMIGRPRVVVGLVYIAKALYPDRFADINPDDVEKEYAQKFGFGNDKTQWIYPPFNDPENTIFSTEMVPS
jgi:iron complex transport system substrate-binding protein